MKKNKKIKEKKPSKFVLPEEIKKKIAGVTVFLLAIIITLSFFNEAGKAGQFIFFTIHFLIGKTVFLLPLILVLSGLAFFLTKYKKFFFAEILAIFLVILAISGILGTLNLNLKEGGWLGYLIAKPFFQFFGFWVSQIIFAGLILISSLIFWHLLKQPTSFLEKERRLEKKEEKQPLVRRMFRKVVGEPSFKIKEVEPSITFEKEAKTIQEPSLELKTQPISPPLSKVVGEEYQPPALELLDSEREKPTAGDIRTNAAIIKKTLENFGISVEMSEINVGPTVTQYTLKPAEGIKLSKITALSNDLALALASHPIRIEAPIPGKSLVGIEIPNKIRAQVRLRDLISFPQFQQSISNLTFVLGRDVLGNPVYADLARMPHLLVAGSTGTGKTVGVDTFIFTEKGMLTFGELCPLPLNSEVDFKIKLVTRDGIEETAKSYNNGICQFYKLSTSRGYQIEATAEHPLWTMGEDGSEEWKPASLIKKGDYVAISRGPALFGNKIDLFNFKPSKIKIYHRKIFFPSKMTPQLAQFLGLLTANGDLSIKRRRTHRVVYSQANPKLLSLYKKLLKKLFGITQFIEKKTGSNSNNKVKDIIIESIHLKEFLTYLGMESVKSSQKEMPRAIREAPKEIVAAYLKAIFDNDGYVGKNSIELCISSKKLASQVHIMLLNFGIVSSLSIKKVKKYANNEYYKISIYGDDARKLIKEIGFIRKEKYKKAEQFFKLSSNSNIDLIPHISSLLKKITQKYFNRFVYLINRGWSYQSGILVSKYAFSSLKSYNSGFRTPGYQSLKKILNFYQSISQKPEYQELNYNLLSTSSHSFLRMDLSKISQRNFYWDRVKKIERTSGVGYDFFVPGSDSFVGNGFVNHNTIFLNGLILSLLYRNSPEILRFILIDPKRVEFSIYNELPHLLSPVIFDGQKTINVLKWLIVEMERRFDILSSLGARDFNSYNEKALRLEKTPLPYIVLIIDELADLMASRGREVEAGIVRLAQMARAVGIHLVVATQRPSVEVITGLIKANITSRVTFQVASQVDSRTVLDMAGAEKLLGLGDMLFVSAEIVKPKRIQSAYVTEKEIKRVVNWLKSTSTQKFGAAGGISLPSQTFPLTEEILVGGGGLSREIGFENGQDPLYEEAKRVVIEARKASASLLQRKLRIGYARAARLIDIMEERGVVGPGEGAKPREVYIKSAEENEDYSHNSSTHPESEGWQKI
ncbi:MAG: DNA translocase FtsK [Patescibacteria group bacterium]|nr:DNA translocase FtsK [Patescibacteria group bacterium]